MATPSSSTTVFRLRPQAPGHHLPPHIIERHRRVLAGILHKRFLIDRWRRNVVMAAEPEPRERPTYQSRLREQFLELRDALPAPLKPKAADRVAIMENGESLFPFQTRLQRLMTFVTSHVLYCRSQKCTACHSKEAYGEPPSIHLPRAPRSVAYTATDIPRELHDPDALPSGRGPFRRRE